MHAIMGGTGHVGSAVAEALLSRGEQVIVITRAVDGPSRLRDQGARFAQADVEDVDSLRAAFRGAKRAFLLNPPADVAQDTDTIERRTVAKILEALEGASLEKVVAASTGGAQEGECLGDLNVLWELERGLRRQPIPAAINRGAYYMSNWDGLLESVEATGKLSTIFPADLAIPMVAPADLGRFAADRLLSGTDDIAIREVEGPERYTVRQVADAFARALGKPVGLDITPRAGWKDAFLSQGFSEKAATSYARMSEASVDGGFEFSDTPLRGTVSLQRYIAELVARRHERK